MATISEAFPEWDCIKNGDPYWAEISKADDIITDYRYNFELLGLDEREAATTADWVERWQLSYELETLFRWWALWAGA